jgi:hypothetical protein
MRGREEKCINNCSEGEHLKDLGVNGKTVEVNLKEIG